MTHYSADFRKGQPVLFTATNNTKIAARLVRPCKARPGYWFLDITGRLGTQCEHYSRLTALANNGHEAVFVLVAGSPAQAAAAAHARNIPWTRRKRGQDCRIGFDESAGIVPLEYLGDVVRWYCEDSTQRAGTCLFYNRTTI
jgi:hypothetical protein